MSNTKHTQGPWSFIVQDDIDADGNGYRWALKVERAGYHQNPAYANSEQNAARIAECVNAMEGVKDPGAFMSAHYAGARDAPR